MNTKSRIRKNLSTGSLIGGAISLVLLTSPTSSFAASAKEQCAGVVKAGLNDCASVEHICAGMNTDNGNASDWLWLPTGTCNKIKGAQVITKPPKEEVKSD